ncbi:hypothetical protein BJ165DRAFT_1453744 [Panaeolus papilionaceus]|nr:hypothetical protein BJ165DRAFT_1453744 [Panaeolus papilionaceus]
MELVTIHGFLRLVCRSQTYLRVISYSKVLQGIPVIIIPLAFPPPTAAAGGWKCTTCFSTGTVFSWAWPKAQEIYLEFRLFRTCETLDESSKSSYQSYRPVSVTRSQAVFSLAYILSSYIVFYFRHIRFEWTFWVHLHCREREIHFSIQPDSLTVLPPIIDRFYIHNGACSVIL